MSGRGDGGYRQPDPDGGSPDHRQSGRNEKEEEVPSGLRRFFGGAPRQSARAMDAAYTLVGAIALFGLLGLLADRIFGTKPWCLASGLLLGAALGYLRLGLAMFRSQ